MSVDPGSAPRRGLRRAITAGLVSAGGVLGFCGVAVSAAASHIGGSALGQTAGTFLLIHAAAVLAIASLVELATRPVGLVSAGAFLTLGTGLFAGDLVLAGFWDLRPFPPAAPIGGGLLLVGWLMVAAGGAVWRRRR